MKALIKDKKVVQIVNDGQDFPVHNSMYWMNCDATVKVGYVLQGLELVESPEMIAERERLESDDNKRALEMPSMQEKVDAMFEALANKKTVKLQEVKNKIDAANEKYPRGGA